MDRQSAVTKLGFAVLACNSALAIRNSWGDAGSVAFVLAADAALLLLFLYLRREFERARGGAGTGSMGGPYSALARVVLAVLTCTTALDTYDVRRDALSAALVAVSYAALLVILTCLFFRAFVRSHGGEQE